jgi:four helix bundle protein
VAKGDDIQERLIKVAVAAMPSSGSGSQLASKLLRSGTSPAPNYAEARGAESDRDFVHKLGIVLKELNESIAWLRIIGECQFQAPEALDALRGECVTLCRIIAASINTVKQRRKWRIEDRESKIEN